MECTLGGFLAVPFIYSRFSAYIILGDNMSGKFIIKRLIAVITAFAVSMLFTAASSANTLQKDKKREYKASYVLMEASTGSVIRSHDGDVPVNMGSFNKLMVVLLAAEAVERGEMSFDTVITASENANSKQGAQIWLMPGEKMTLGDLMKAIIIGNANDACCAVGEALGGSEAGCTELMNNRARELMMNDTVFTECTGYYDDQNQHTTASDGAKLLCRLSEFDFLTELFTTRLDELKDGGVQLVTSNPMGHNYKGSVGFKCGTGPASGYFAAEGAMREGVTYVCCVMDCKDEDTALALAKELLGIAFEGYTLVTPELPEKMPGTIKVKQGVKPEARLSVEAPGAIVVPKGSGDDIKAEIYLPSYIYAPLKRGDKAGEMRYYLGGRLLKSCNINSADDIETKNIKNVLWKLMKFLVSF